MCGRLKTVVAMKSEKMRDKNDKVVPRAISKMRPDKKILLTSSLLLSAIHFAALRTMAESTPNF